jgi:hypothetical protein
VDRPGGFKAERHVVQVRVAVAYRPPELRVADVQHGSRGWRERHQLAAGGPERDRLLKREIAKLPAQRAGDGLRAVVHQRRLDGHVGA